MELGIQNESQARHHQSLKLDSSGSISSCISCSCRELGIYVAQVCLIYLTFWPSGLGSHIVCKRLEFKLSCGLWNLRSILNLEHDTIEWCISRNNKTRLVRPTHIGLNSSELRYNLFMVKLYWCSGSINILDDIQMKQKM